MRERIIIVFVAIAIGLIVTTLVFFLYQQTKSLPQKITQGNNNNLQNKENSTASSVPLTVEAPQSEILSQKRTIEVKGTTSSENVVVVSTNQEDVIVKPTDDGKFSATIDIDTGANKIVTRAIAPNGDSAEDIRIVTFNTEEF